MEPMTLGSAPSSPSSPSANPNFLPAFLMGDNSQTATPNPNTSPGRRTSARKLGATSTPDPRTYPRLFNQTLDSPKPFTPHKPGPPSQGLFDTIEQNRKPTSPVLQSTAIGDSFNYSRNLNETSNLSRVDRIDTHWVTVFGFPPSALSLVLAQLSNCGVIVEKKVPAQGNWLHVKFNNLCDVPRALALNGRCISNNIMIGVSLHYDKENKENENVFTSPVRARSLRHSFITPSGNNSVLPPQNVPQKSTGLVSKAIEYVFGW
ncbi:nucleoporin Nup35 [Tribolium madens]|uniref:nucleoporin Nup35 n=1 Tax=Tribolium madens TaxID=41895 RepID=UPI001CF73AF0|nr:nucleoporin Nup35 [Tribolium madens]